MAAIYSGGRDLSKAVPPGPDMADALMLNAMGVYEAGGDVAEPLVTSVDKHGA